MMRVHRSTARRSPTKTPDLSPLRAPSTPSARPAPRAAPPAPLTATATTPWAQVAGFLRVAGTVLYTLPMLIVALCVPQWVGRKRPVPPEGSPERNYPTPVDLPARLAALTVVPPKTRVEPPQLPGPSRDDGLSTVPRGIEAATNARFLHQEGFDLVLPAGFMGMYPHLGCIKGLERSGLRPAVVTGASAGGITAAMYCTLPLPAVEAALVSLSVRDFLSDASYRTFWHQGAISPGTALKDKLQRTLAPSGITRIEACRSPALRLAVFSPETRQTEFRETGDLALTTYHSAALPILFHSDGDFDGGWMDHHLRLALTPGRRALVNRVDGIGNSIHGLNAQERAVGRLPPILDLSRDPAHRTLILGLPERVSEASFLLDVDFRKAKLRRIIDAAEQGTLWWLHQPSAA